MTKKFETTMEFNIKPAEFLQEIGWQFKARGEWLSLKLCPFCSGGNSCDVFTFAVHATDGNFFCHRSKCSISGNFWKLIELNQRNPRAYIGEKTFKKRKKKFIYGKN